MPCRCPKTKSKIKNTNIREKGEARGRKEGLVLGLELGCEVRRKGCLTLRVGLVRVRVRVRVGAFKVHGTHVALRRATLSEEAQAADGQRRVYADIPCMETAHSNTCSRVLWHVYH